MNMPMVTAVPPGALVSVMSGSALSVPIVAGSTTSTMSASPDLSAATRLIGSVIAVTVRHSDLGRPSRQ